MKLGIKISRAALLVLEKVHCIFELEVGPIGTWRRIITSSGRNKLPGGQSSLHLRQSYVAR